ncbi:MAG: asparaginase domain-containing protein [Burkholderiaceae bacterium]
MTVRILATGGTFDKRYDPVAGQLTFGTTAVADLLATAQARLPVDELLQIDSLDMTDTHRALVAEACTRVTEDRLVVVHGTDTMVETAAVLAERVVGKTIVLTGAMVPHSVHESDAAFNLGFALAAAQCLPIGVYVAMHGQWHDWRQVRKNRAIGRFEASRTTGPDIA